MPDRIVKPGSVPVAYIPVAGVRCVVTGGESHDDRSKARPFDLAWARSLRDQCRAAGCAFHFKQTGCKAIDSGAWDIVGPGGAVHYTRPSGHPILVEDQAPPGYIVQPRNVSRLLQARKGDNPQEWPEDLRIQEPFPD
jgi:hypothetical protein